MEEIRFDGKVAVITGAGGGLGRSHALLLASRGAKVVVNDLGGSTDGTGSDTTPAQQVVDEIKSAGGEAVADYNNVADWESAQKIIQTALDAFGSVDILINNAGILRDKSLLKMEIEDYKAVLSVHLDGTFHCTKAAFPHMKENGYGRIINTISGAGLYGNFGQTNYGAAKMGILGFTLSVKQEGAKYNILANILTPVAGTRLTASIMPPNVLEKLKPEVVSPMAGWMASELCDVSGKIFIAGAGYFSRAAVVEGPGIYLDPDSEITMETVAERIGEIGSLEGAQEFEAAMEAGSRIFSVLM
jgi:NAD(P)-dependent dehydrogenase (short-subunit alcohol dehydrogenase family)